MKTNPVTPQKQPKDQVQNQAKTKQRPENKDDLDSRKHEEQLKKGDDITHNKKEVHKEPKKHK